MAKKTRTVEQDLADLRREVKALKRALGNFIVSTAQSSASPIAPATASLLLNQMNQFE